MKSMDKSLSEQSQIITLWKSSARNMVDSKLESLTEKLVNYTVALIDSSPDWYLFHQFSSIIVQDCSIFVFSWMDRAKSKITHSFYFCPRKSIMVSSESTTIRYGEVSGFKITHFQQCCSTSCSFWKGLNDIFLPLLNVKTLVL